MATSEGQPWESTRKEIEQLRTRLASLGDDERKSEVMVEIAVQLIWLNANLEELQNAVHRIADNA